jgi:hypothetical protein
MQRGDENTKEKIRVPKFIFSLPIKERTKGRESIIGYLLPAVEL